MPSCFGFREILRNRPKDGGKATHQGKIRGGDSLGSERSGMLEKSWRDDEKPETNNRDIQAPVETPASGEGKGEYFVVVDVPERTASLDQRSESRRSSCVRDDHDLAAPSAEDGNSIPVLQEGEKSQEDLSADKNEQLVSSTQSAEEIIPRLEVQNIAEQEGKPVLNSDDKNIDGDDEKVLEEPVSEFKEDIDFRENEHQLDAKTENSIRSHEDINEVNEAVTVHSQDPVNIDIGEKKTQAEARTEETTCRNEGGCQSGEGTTLAPVEDPANVDVDQERPQVDASTDKDISESNEDTTQQSLTDPTNADFDPKKPRLSARTENNMLIEEAIRELKEQSPVDATNSPWDSALRTFSGSTEPIMAFSPDNRLMATATKATLDICDPTTGSLVQAFKQEQSRCLAFSPNGNILASGSYFEPTITLWDTEKWQEKQTLKRFTGDEFQIFEFSPVDETLACISHTALWMWNLKTSRMLWSTSQYFQSPSLSFSPDGGFIATTKSNRVILYDSKTGKIAHDLKDDSDAAFRHVSFSPDGGLVAAHCGDKLKMWETTTWSACESSISVGEAGELVSFVFSPDSSLVALGISNGAVQLRDIKTGSLTHTLECSPMPQKLVFFQNGQILASASNSGLIQLWDVTPDMLKRT